MTKEKEKNNQDFVIVRSSGHVYYKCLHCAFDCADDLNLMNRHQREIHRKKHEVELAQALDFEKEPNDGKTDSD